LEQIRRFDLDIRSKTRPEPAPRLRSVPLEGHWDRLNTPLRETTPRERSLVRIVVALLAAAALASVIVAIATSASGGSTAGLAAAGARCVDLDVPSTMGGSTIHACGGRAAEFCRSPVANQPPLAEAARARCREAGYPVAPQ
jgi:hypothetical protein